MLSQRNAPEHLGILLVPCGRYYIDWSNSCLESVNKYSDHSSVDPQQGWPASTLECRVPISLKEGFPGGSEVKNPPANAGDAGSIPGSGRCPGEGNGHPFQYPFLGHPLDRGAWWTTVLGVAKSQTQLSIWAKIYVSLYLFSIPRLKLSPKKTS